MKQKNDFIIPIKSLLDGDNLLNFKVSEVFFENYCDEYSDFKGGNFSVKAGLKKSNNIFTISLNIYGTLKVECDRCLDNMDLDININDTIYAKLAKTETFEDDYITILEDKNELDLSSYIYEIISTNLPIKKNHAEGKCNPEMLERLDSYLIKEKKEKSDPRWDKLKDLLK